MKTLSKHVNGKASWIGAMVSSAVVVVACGGGCAPKPRAIKGTVDGQQLKKVVITLENMETADLDRPNNIFELTGCIDPVLNGPGSNVGTFDRSKSQVSVSHPKLKLSSACNLSVKTLTPDPTMSFMDGAGNQLYKAQGFEIYQTPEGQLVANARLQKTYQLEVSVDQKFILQIALTFPQKESGTLITGLLQGCQPAFAAYSVFKRKTDTEGDLELVASVPTATEFQCATIWIGVDGTAEKYYFRPSGGFKFAAKPRESANLTIEKLLINPFPQSDPTSVHVETTALPQEKLCDFSKQIFNTVRGQCEPKP